MLDFVVHTNGAGFGGSGIEGIVALTVNVVHVFGSDRSPRSQDVCACVHLGHYAQN